MFTTTKGYIYSYTYIYTYIHTYIYIYHDLATMQTEEAAALLRDI